MNINARIKALRKVRGLNQTEFSSRIGLKQSALSSIESVSVGVTEQNIRLICDTFHVSEQWLREGVGEMDAPPPGGEKDPLVEWAESLVERGEEPSFAYSLASSLSKLGDVEWQVLEGIFEKIAESSRVRVEASAVDRSVHHVDHPVDSAPMTMEEKAAAYDAQQAALKKENSSFSLFGDETAATGKKNAQLL